MAHPWQHQILEHMAESAQDSIVSYMLHDSRRSFLRQQPDPEASPIHSWLNQMQTITRSSLREESECDDTGDFTRPKWRPHDLPLPTQELTHGKPISRRQNGDDNDSLLLTVLSDDSDNADSTTSRRKSSDLQIHVRGTKRQQQPSPLVDRHRSSSSRFEKRLRHKTRVDKYDTKKPRNKPAMVKSYAPSQSNKAKESKRQKLRSSREVVQNFDPPTVEAEKVTVRSSPLQSHSID